MTITLSSHASSPNKPKEIKHNKGKQKSGI